MEWTQNGQAGTSGAVTLTFRPSGTRPWRVDQVSVEMVRTDTTAVAGLASCVVRKNGAYITPVVAQGDAAAGDPPVKLGPTDNLTVEWTAANSGDICKATIIYEVL